MNIDLILTEWCYRLPKGYPTTSKDYEVLYQVIVEVANVTPDYARQIVERAKGASQQLIAESIEIDSIENPALVEALNAAGKIAEFRQFLSLLPTEADPITLVLPNLLIYYIHNEVLMKTNSTKPVLCQASHLTCLDWSQKV